jgi:hypothetical protein
MGRVGVKDPPGPLWTCIVQRNLEARPSNDATIIDIDIIMEHIKADAYKPHAEQSNKSFVSSRSRSYFLNFV